ncbi:MAG: zf-HC2 domain-containing protein [Ignavibacteriae bacterium]|nr:zf-HC2 domain-containing protein [Ignavibacteriota bacterium]
MKCSEVEVLLPDYVVNKLSNGQYSGVQSHLERCSDCRATADELLHLLLGLKEMKPQEPSELYFAAILPRLHERLAAKKQSFQIPEYVQRFILPFAMTVMLVMLIINYQPQSTTTIKSRAENILQENGTENLDYLLGLEVNGTVETNTQDDRSVITEILAEITENIPLTEDVTETILSSMNESDASRLLALLEQPAEFEQR